MDGTKGDTSNTVFALVAIEAALNIVELERDIQENKELLARANQLMEDITRLRSEVASILSTI